MGTGFNVKDLEPFGKGFALPKRGGAAISNRTLPYRVEVEFILEDGRFVCEALRVERKRGGPPVTSKRIRELPVQDLLRTAVTEYIHRVRKIPGTKDVVITPTQLRGLKQYADAGPTTETLEWVTFVYRLSFAFNENPTEAVIDAFGLPRSTAERWVSNARDLGLIDTPDPRRRK